MTLGIWTAITRWTRTKLIRRCGLTAGDRDSQAASSASDPDWCIAGEDDHSKLVARFLDQGRIAILLRPQIAGTLAPEHFAVLSHVFRQKSAWVRRGVATIGAWTYDGSEKNSGHFGIEVERVKPFYIDRFAVTNRDYKKFVSDGGYAQQALWNPAGWAEVHRFVDQTETVGPRFWRHGGFDDELAHCPVVGVSWFEADAYARWCGKRLASDAQWIRAAACSAGGNEDSPETTAPEIRPGNRANVWSTGIGRVVAVDRFYEETPTGIAQLMGNVWEWTADDAVISSYRRPVVFDPPLKKLRGGAFDTYFDQHASPDFPSGDLATARRPNIGFRCAISSDEIVELERPV